MLVTRNGAAARRSSACVTRSDGPARTTVARLTDDHTNTRGSRARLVSAFQNAWLTAAVSTSARAAPVKDQDWLAKPKRNDVTMTRKFAALRALGTLITKAPLFPAGTVPTYDTPLAMILPALSSASAV